MGIGRRAGLLPLLASLCACSTVIHVTPKGPNDAVALVYFIRQDLSPTAIRGDLHVNNLLVATVADDSFAAVDVPAGTNTIELRWPEAAGDDPVVFDIEVMPNETLYVLMTGLTRTDTDVYGLLLVHTFSKNVRIQKLEPSDAKSLLAEM